MAWKPIPLVNGEFQITAEQVKQVNQLMAKLAASDDIAQHRLFAQTILGPIRQYADYVAWTEGIFAPQSRSLSDIVRVVLDYYTAIAFSTVPGGGVRLVRPGSLFTTVTLEMFNTGLEIGWYQPELSGWDILSRKIKEAGLEMARKMDTIRKTAIDTAVAAVSGRTSTVATTMTKASVDAIIKSAANSGFSINHVRINTGTVMDMAGWTWPTGSMWANIGADRVEEVLKTLAITGYGGAEWRAFKEVPTDYVYFFAVPEDCGYEWSVNTGVPRQHTAMDMQKGVDQYRWDDFLGVYASGYGMWRLQIT